MTADLRGCNAGADIPSLAADFLGDDGYTGGRFTQGVQQILRASVEIAKRNELHPLK
ncbi:hypothetical protein JJB74_32530 [Noviherbaspirillum sp. DKR-6]|uniref:Uncharacterized protein n=1 Tax=Noviherbaspirillum pedocola TaxID=2801341 RepID=A0A934SZE4_9BURK|nr:hypothetical protein [Noviherbaspirillum pedocola]